MKRPMPDPDPFPQTIVYDGHRCPVQRVDIAELDTYLKREGLRVLPPDRILFEFEWGKRWYPVLLVTKKANS